MYCVEADAGVHTPGKCNNNTESRPIRGQGHEPLTNERTDRGSGMQVVPSIDAEVTPSLQCSAAWNAGTGQPGQMQQAQCSQGGFLTNTVTQCAHEICIK